MINDTNLTLCKVCTNKLGYVALGYEWYRKCSNIHDLLECPNYTSNKVTIPLRIWSLTIGVI